jgi:hypothetical protein
MKNYVLENGMELDVCEMIKIKNHYERECTKEFILDNYDYSDEEATKLACEIRDYMDDYEVTETDAIQIILEGSMF